MFKKIFAMFAQSSMEKSEEYTKSVEDAIAELPPEEQKKIADTYGRKVEMPQEAPEVKPMEEETIEVPVENDIEKAA